MFTVDKCTLLKRNIGIYYLHAILKEYQISSAKAKYIFSLWTVGSFYIYYSEIFMLSKPLV